MGTCIHTYIHKLINKLFYLKYLHILHIIIQLSYFPCHFTLQLHYPMKMRRECSVSGCVHANVRERSGGASIRSTVTSSWPPTWDSPPTAPTAEISSGKTLSGPHLSPFISFTTATSMQDSLYYKIPFRHIKAFVYVIFHVDAWWHLMLITGTPLGSNKRVFVMNINIESKLDRLFFVLMWRA